MRTLAVRSTSRSNAISPKKIAITEDFEAVSDAVLGGSIDLQFATNDEIEFVAGIAFLDDHPVFGKSSGIEARDQSRQCVIGQPRQERIARSFATRG